MFPGEVGALTPRPGRGGAPDQQPPLSFLLPIFPGNERPVPVVLVSATEHFPSTTAWIRRNRFWNQEIGFCLRFLASRVASTAERSGDIPRAFLNIHGYRPNVPRSIANISERSASIPKSLVNIRRWL